MRFLTDNALSLADATQATQTSPALDASQWLSCSVIGVAAGATITGTLKVQASNDLVSPTNWVDLPSQTVSVTAAGVYVVPKFDVSYMWLRVVYTKTTSAGGALITAQIKSVGF